MMGIELLIRNAAMMLAAALALVVPGIAQAAPTPAPPNDESGRYVLRAYGPDGKLQEKTIKTGTNGVVSCDMFADRPHFSNGTGGVIYKTRVYCRGDVPAVDVRVKGALSVFGYGSGPGGPPPGGPALPIATSDLTQRVVIGSANPVTYYTPAAGAPTVPGNQWAQGSSGGEIVEPGGSSNIGQATTPRVFA